MSLARKPVKATYAHKRGRATALMKSSSPLEDGISRSGMSRRMLKRSHCSDQSHIPSEQHSLVTQDRTSKRRKSAAGARVDVPDPNSISLVDFVHFDVDDLSQFQTPYPSLGTEQFRLDSSVGQHIPPEKFSPLPIARRILSRTNSRDLKENLFHPSRHLASPFSSRPGSVTSSPKGKSKNKRRPLNLKSRDLSDSNQQNDLQQKDSVLAITQSTQTSPISAKGGPRDRRPSVPAPDYLLQQMSRQDWLVPPKALSRSMLAECNSVFGSPSDFISTFLEDFPQAVSTPHHQRVPSNAEYPTSVRASQNVLQTSETIGKWTANEVFSDVIMADDTSIDVRTPERLIKFTGSGVSTIPTYPSSPLTHDTGSSVPAAQNVFKLVSLSNYNTAFPHLMRSPGIYDDEDSIVSPSRPVHRPIPLPSLDSSPEGFSDNSPPALFTDHPAWSNANNLGDGDPVIATPPPSPPKSNCTRPLLLSSPATGQKLRDMFSVLDIDESSKGTDAGDQPSHDSGIGMTSFSSRTRSLDSATETKNKKDKGTRTRDRRGTIRASDYTQLKDSNGNHVATTHGNGPMLTRRTRSGTVIGPPKPLNSTSTKAPTPTAANATRGIKMVTRNDSGLLPPLSDGESEDELLLKTHCYGDYQVPVADKATLARAPDGGLIPPSETESDDDLLLKVEKNG